MKKTKIKIELVTDMDIFYAHENGIKEGTTRTIKQYAEANDNYVNAALKIKMLLVLVN